ncbi:uncharacterized protein LOC143046800 [Mytilus galloprovincialis]|uniref:uncharacterized protein LOC143046800 n=1 Tax=Mytilus galloprovincialis TaxID=29158 RepID=UPI003F7C16CE
MVKISKYNVLWLVLECRVLFGLGETGSLKLTLCEHPEQEHKTASCPSDKILRLGKITSGGFACQDYNNRDMCHSNINTFFKNNCLQKQNCILPTKILPDSNCQRQPRRLEVEFECSLLLSFKYTVHTCANSLAEVHCHLWHYIEIKKVKSISDENFCQSNVSSSAKDTLMSLCDGKHKCLPDTTKHLGLFHERLAIVSYLCKEQTDPLVTESIQSTSSDPKLDMTTIFIADATVEQDTLPELKFDKDHRIEINHHSLNQTLHLCGLGWDDYDAGVLCKSIDRTWIGKSIVVDNMQDLTVAPYSLQCGGLEKSLSVIIRRM